MDFDEWKPFYLEIVKDLNLNVEKDRDAAEKLDHLIKNDEAKQKLQERVKKQVLVLGDAPKLKREIKAIDKDVLNQK
ncbi:MAG: 6-hydroxymethyl-7,8-dihydropterin pyrophosphokinase, partial [Methanonatronarchaeia archaeon]